MEEFPSLKTDDYTRFLVLLARGEFLEIFALLCFEVDGHDPEMIRLHYSGRTFEIHLDIYFLFHQHIVRFQHEIWKQMAVVHMPLFLLFPPDLSVNPAIFEVFEVAELRHRALMRRLIGRDILMWAFYKCGYALPPEVCISVTLKKPAVYHLSEVCRAALKLAESLGVETLELQHVIFAVLYRNEIDVDDKSPIGPEVARHFDNFMRVVEGDTKNRPQRTTSLTRQDAFRHIFEGEDTKFKMWALNRTRYVTTLTPFVA